MSIWSDITNNFNVLMLTHVTASVSNSFSEYKDSVELGTIPSSIFNGAYSIQQNGIPQIQSDVNTVLDYQYEVRLQTAFLLNQNDEKTTYNNAMHDVEEIIRKRLDVTTFSDSILNVQLNVCNKPRFIGNASDEQFLVVDMDFAVTGRATL